ncbi:hypothetical protein [Xylella taiwanensis]|nr:hypothetical protein [Xylella taiwanensis]UFN05001.1 hypothetical protein LPH41_02975 [Xylella taiwanensis]
MKWGNIAPKEDSPTWSSQLAHGDLDIPSVISIFVNIRHADPKPHLTLPLPAGGKRKMRSTVL